MHLCKRLRELYFLYGFWGTIAVLPAHFKIFLRRHLLREIELEEFSCTKDNPIDEHFIERRIAECKSKKLRITFYVHLIRSLGDIIACEPIPRFLKSLAPNAKLYWILYGKYKSVVQYNPYIDGIIEVHSLGESSALIHSKEREEGAIAVDLHLSGLKCIKTGEFHHNYVNPSVNMSNYLQYGNLLESFSLGAGLPKLKDKPQFHFAPNVCVPVELPEKYIVFHCKSAMTFKDWSARKWNKLARILMKQGYKIVEIGENNVIKSHNKFYFDCTTKHDLQTIAKIIEKADFFVGIDSAFAHFANCFDKKAVLILGILPFIKEYNLYSGNYSSETGNATILFEKGRGSFFVKLNDVLKVILEKTTP